MIDYDLARIYGYETKAFNQQVKRNIERFPSDFMFELTDEKALQCSRSQNVTLKILFLILQLLFENKILLEIYLYFFLLLDLIPSFPHYKVLLHLS